VTDAQLLYGILADLTVLAHAGFVVFAVLGGLLVVRFRRLAWAHVPAVLWAAAIEFAGWICPLTPLENWFRARAGLAGYGSGFVEHYILPVLYPTSLTREVQVVLGVSVLVVNAGIYCWVVRRRGKRES
jgi:hypothetical protein